MASSNSSFHLFLFSLAFALFTLGSNAAAAAKVKNPHFILSIKKDDPTKQYYTEINMGTPQNIINVVIDLGGDLLWFNCDNGAYKSSTYRPMICGSRKCKVAKATDCLSCSNAPAPGCTNNTCGVVPHNPIADWFMNAMLGEDNMRVHETDGNVYLNQIDVPKFPFACSSPSHLDALANHTQGLMGLGRTQIALPNQLSMKFNIPRKFALCIPSSSKLGYGSMFVGGGSYHMQPYGDAANLLVRTPLLINPVNTLPRAPEGATSDEYFIGVKSIKVEGKVVPFNNSLLSFDKSGNGGTKLSTTVPYTVLHSEIYKALVRAFVNKAASMKMSRVPPVAPFGACFRSKNIASTITGPAVPNIDLELEGNAHWRIYGANSMVKVNKNVICLGFVDAGPRLIQDGPKPIYSIVIGGHQLEDNLLEFDLTTSKLGFTSSLLLHNTTCSHSRIF